jgi:hypothetical protein
MAWGAGDGVQPALGEGGKRRWGPAVGVLDEARSEVDDVAGALRGHLPDGSLGDVEEPGQVHGGGHRVVVERVVGGDEDARVVDERVDPPEATERLIDHALGGLTLCDVAGDREQVRVIRRVNRSQGGDDGVAGAAKARDEARTDAARRAGDDRGLHSTR